MFETPLIHWLAPSAVADPAGNLSALGAKIGLAVRHEWPLAKTCCPVPRIGGGGGRERGGMNFFRITRGQRWQGNGGVFSVFFAVFRFLCGQLSPRGVIK